MKIHLTKHQIHRIAKDRWQDVLKWLRFGLHHTTNHHSR